MVLLAVAIATVVSVITVSHFVSSSSHQGAAGSLPQSSASYLGVYETGAPSSYLPVANFTRAVGKQPNLVGYYSGWWEPFKTSFAETVHKHGAAPILQWDPHPGLDLEDCLRRL